MVFRRSKYRLREIKSCDLFSKNMTDLVYGKILISLENLAKIYGKFVFNVS